MSLSFFSILISFSTSDLEVNEEVIKSSYCKERKDCSGTLTFGSTVKIISYRAFSNCTGFTGNLVIPDTVTSVGVEEFYDCSSLKGALTIPSSVTEICASAFYHCSGFTEMVINV